MMKTDVPNKLRQVVIPLLLLLLLLDMQSYAQTLPANFQRVLVTGGLTGPTTFAQLPDGRILIGQQNGQLRVFKNNALLATPAISLSVSTSGERGLIGIAVDPNFSTNSYIYLYYTSSSGPHNRVSRFTMSGDLATAESAILDMPTLGDIFHNGGGLAFDNTGKLLVAVGDNKVGGNSSNLDSYLGKVLRINTDGTVPTGNPFTGGAQRSRVWAYGLRNPFTLNTDPVSGKIYVNDVGESTWEEINDASAGGRNFGWPSKEGMCTSGCTGLTNPAYYYATNRSTPPTTGQGCAINGGTFLNGSISNWPATYHGKYFFLDYCGAWIDYINPSSPATRNGFGTGLSDGLTTLKQGIDGNLYFIRRGNNSLYKIIYSGNAAPVITTQPQNISKPQGQTATFNVTATGNPAPTYQWRKGTTNIAGATASSYSISNVQPANAGSYNVVVTNSAGTVTSNNATLTVTAPNAFPVATITSPANNSPFRGGDVISFTGTATDAEDGTLPASAYTWWVDFHHANHVHPGPELADGVTGGGFPISVQGHTETDIWYRLYLEVTDSQGEKDTSFIEIFPVTSNVTLQTVPVGLQITLNEIPFTTPSIQASLSGMVRPMAAPSPQSLAGTNYVFDHWDHGGARQQDITITDNNVTYTAHFTVAPTPCLPVSASADDGNVPANVLDNNLATRWSASGNGQWIAFCLSSVQTVTGVQIAFYSGNTRSSNFDIQASSNGTSWNTVAAGLSSSGTSLNLETFNIPSQSTQYIRILGHGNSVNLWNSYTEVKINTSSGSTETALAPVHDAYTRNGASATLTHGTTDPNALVVKLNSNPAAGNDRQTFLTFNTSSITSTVTNVKIRLYGGLTDNRSTNTPLAASAVASTTWTESALTWNNKPAIGATLITTNITDSVKRFYTWDVTSYVLAEKAAGRHTVSFAIAATAATTPILSFNSKEAGSNAPQLVVTHNTSLLAGQTIAVKSDATALPTQLQSFPNPFGDNLTVTYTLKTAGRVRLALVDISGRQVGVLTDAVQTTGQYRTTYKAGHLPSGMYILKLNHNGKVFTQKLVKE